jgi:hypothetical protein
MKRPWASRCYQRGRSKRKSMLIAQIAPVKFRNGHRTFADSQSKGRRRASLHCIAVRRSPIFKCSPFSPKIAVWSFARNFLLTCINASGIIDSTKIYALERGSPTAAFFVLGLPISWVSMTYTHFCDSRLCVIKCVLVSGLEPIDSALFQVPHAVSPLFATLTKTAGGVAQLFPFWNSPLNASG